MRVEKVQGIEVEKSVSGEKILNIVFLTAERPLPSLQLDWEAAAMLKDALVAFHESIVSISRVLMSK